VKNGTVRWTLNQEVRLQGKEEKEDESVFVNMDKLPFYITSTAERSSG